MEKELDWGEMYLDKCMEVEDLKKEIRVLQEILRVYLPVIDGKGDNENSRDNK